MADSFQNPQDQANLSALQARLSQIEAEIRSGQSQLAAEVAAVREQTRGTVSGSRTTATALPSLRAEATAINEQVVSYERLNQLIIERIGLEARAAAAAREGVTASAGGRDLASVAPNWSSERQRILGIMSAGGSAPSQAAMGAAALGAGQAKAAAGAKSLVMSEAEVQAQLQRSSAAFVEYDQTLLKTGALSGAALGALADGTITVSELGHQVGQTIAKFGGWTIAASAVFGVIGAVDELKKGAVDTSSAIQGLSKFIPEASYNPDEARKQIIQQAQATATPLKDVGDASQQFAKVFKDQGDVFTATHVSLAAAKLDNISLADSYKFLTAIVQETGVGVSALPGIFDQITAAQDRLGARVSQILPAFAGSIGAVQTAGGDMSQLLGLEALTLVRTGRSGSQVATGYARGATNFFPTANSRGVLSRYGVNPNQGFTQALIEAIMKAEQENLPEAERRQLSTAFFGPLRGSMFTNLFNTNPAQLQHFIKETGAGANSGLTEQQLAKTMGQANNQLALLKVNLQAIGAELTGSGITTPFSALLQILNKTLESSGHLLQVWNSLPGPLKEIASLSAVAFGGVALARRFNVGAMVAGAEGAGGVRGALGSLLSPSADTLAQKRAGQYVSAVEEALASQQASASAKLLQSQIQLAAANDQLKAVRAAEGASGEAVADAEARLAAADTTAATAASELAALTSETMTARIAEMRAAAGMTGAGVAGAAAAGGLGGAAAGGAGAAGAASKLDVLEALGLGGLAGGLGKAGAAAAFLKSNALPIAATAYFSYDMATQSVKSGEGAASKGIAGIENAQTGGQATDAYNQALGAGSIRVPLLGIHIPNGFGALGNFLGGQDSAMAGDLKAKREELQGNADALYHTLPLLDRINAAQRSHNYGQAYKLAKGDLVMQDLEPQEYQKLLSDLHRQWEGKAATGGKGANPFAGFPEASQDLKNRLGPMFQGISDSAKIFGTESGDLNRLAAGYFYAVEKFGSNRNDTQAMQVLAQAQGDLVNAVDKRVTDLVNLAKMSTTDQGQQGYYTQALQAVSKTQSQIKAMADAATKLPGAHVGQIRQAEQQALGAVAQKRSTAISGLLDLMKSETDLQVSQVGGVGPEADLKRAVTQLQGLGRQIATAHKYGADAQQLNQLQAQYNQQAVTVLQDRLTFDQQLADALMQFAQSQTADPVQQAAIGVQKLGQLYSQLQAAGAPQTQLLQVAAQQQQQITAGISAQISQEQAATEAQLAQMNIGQPQQVQLQNAVTVASQQLSFILSQPASRVSPAQISQAYSKLYQAQGALAQFWIEQGRTLIQAQTALAQGQTFDPVAIANLAVQGAQKLLAYDKAHNATLSTLTQDQAQIAADIKQASEAKWSKQLASVQYLGETYQITLAQEIQRQQKILAEMKKKGASYQSILSLEQTIWNEMFGQGDLNLNTGNMHMPSTYEVKSAIINGRNSTRRKATAGLLADVKTNVTMSVVIERDVDMHKFTKALNDALGTSVNGIAQAAGLV